MRLGGWSDWDPAVHCWCGAVKSGNRIGNIEVYTRENQALIIRDMGACEEEGICEVDTLQNIGADYGITGNVTQIEGTYICTLNLYDVTKGNVMGVEEAGGKVNNLSDFNLNQIDVRAGNPNIYDKMLKKLDNF